MKNSIDYSDVHWLAQDQQNKLLQEYYSQFLMFDDVILIMSKVDCHKLYILT